MVIVGLAGKGQPLFAQTLSRRSHEYEETDADRRDEAGQHAIETVHSPHSIILLLGTQQADPIDDGLASNAPHIADLVKHKMHTDIDWSQKSLHEYQKAGRCRWRVEKETFNTLKNVRTQALSFTLALSATFTQTWT